MGKFKDLTGQKFGRLTVVKREEDYIQSSGKRCVQWLCECKCGNEVVVMGQSLRNGDTQSCGCLNKETASVTAKSNFKKKNTYDLFGEYGIGYTFKGEEFYFDLEDYDKIKDYCWHINKQGYLSSKDTNSNSIKFFHRIIMDCPDNLVVDHIRGKETRNDNRKYNLRICTQHENTMNCDMPVNNTSGITGISWYPKYNKWNSYITIGYKKKNLGYYDNLEDAIRVRREAEEKYFGEYSFNNSRQTRAAIEP